MYEVSRIRYQVSGFRYEVSCIRYQLSAISYQISAMADQFCGVGGDVGRNDAPPPPPSPVRARPFTTTRRGDRVALALAVVFVFVVKGKGGGGGGGPFAIRVTRLMHLPASTTLPPAFVPDFVPVGSPGEKKIGGTAGPGLEYRRCKREIHAIRSTQTGTHRLTPAQI